MLNLSLAAVARGPVGIREQIDADDPLWSDTGVAFKQPLRVDLEARMVGDGVLVRGSVETELDAACRRCLVAVPVTVRDSVDLLFEALSPEEQDELSGEVYALPERGDQLDLSTAIREQVVLRIPDYVLCSESCRGLCPKCGAELNREQCGCVLESPGDAWEALRKIKFD